MFYVFRLFTPLYAGFRLSRVSQTQDLDEIYRLLSKILNFTPCGSVFDRFGGEFAGPCARGVLDLVISLVPGLFLFY